MAITRLEKTLLEAQKSRKSASRKLDIPTEYEIEKYASAVKTEENKALLRVRPHKWVEHSFRSLNRETKKFENFSFKGHDYWVPIYDTPFRKILAKTARQVAKSTWLGNNAITSCCLNLGFHVLYVSPSQMQTKEWMNTRIKGPISESAVLQKFEAPELTDNTLEKRFVTTSKINYRYAFLTADRIRGLSGVNCLMIDEVQDIIMDNIPVIEQTTFAVGEKHKSFLYSGTPKSLDNPIEVMWSDFSTQNEWAIPCHRHSFFVGGQKKNIHWNIIIDDRNIGLKGLICELCGELINARDPMAHWVSTNPSVREKMAMPFEGYHIPQLISSLADWKKILADRQSYSKGRFYNEVLGLSYDHGDKPITKQDLIDNCDDQISMKPESLAKLKDIIFDGRYIYAGIDYSGGSDKSLTVLTLATYIQNFFVFFYMKKYEGSEADLNFQMTDIIKTCREWRVNQISVDYGGGMWPNDILSKEFGMTRVMKFQYGNPKQILKWEPNLGRFIVHRSEVLSSFFGAIKRRNVVKFPNWDEFEPFAADFQSVTANYNEKTRMLIYQHNLNQPDDTVHSSCLNFIGSMCLQPRMDIIRPDKIASYHEETPYY